MRSYGAAALVVLAILAECFGARERSRQRSGPIRSVPVAANVKREVDFDCPEEFGYYPHPTDCTLYYVCVFGGALLESCTGGLMYSHELQTCDWPRNVGCDATGTVVSEQRFSERDRDLPPPPPPPRRTPPPPPPRAKPNPVITSRGQPKFNRQEYEKQQQLYAEVDDLPPVEELENDRQQRVYRGQPSTIGQVQKDRDGYGTQVISSGRTLNSNIIPASIPQNSGKFGSYSFGTQTDDRRTASITPAPQTYRTDNYVTDSSKDSDIDIKTNEIIHNNISKIRIKRDLEVTQNNLTASDKISDKNDSDEIIEYIDFSTGTSLDDNDDVETDRDKRQVRYLLRNGYKSRKNLQYTKPVKITDLQQYNLRSRDLHNLRHQSVYQDQLLNTANRKPFSLENTYFSTANPFMSYQTETMQSQKPFKPSLPDPFNQKNLNNNLYTATQIITKSPPISSLKNEVNQFSSLYGGFYNNAPNEHNMRHNQFSPNTHSSFSKPPVSLHDSSQVPSSIVTNRPISLSSLNHPENDYNLNHIPTKSHPRITKDRLQEMNEKHKQNLNQDNLSETQDYDDSYESDENNESSDEYSDQNFKHVFPDPPYAFTHPSNKYADIENPFARPDFDFDAYLTKLQNDHYSALGITSKPNTSSHKNLKIPIEITTASYKNSVKQTTPLYYQSISTPRPFTISNILTSTSSSMQNNLPSNIKKIQQFTTNPKLTNQSQRAPQSGMYYNGGSKQNIESNIHKLKPPNFTDERQLPITYSFSRPIGTTSNPYFNVSKYSSNFSVTQKPYMVITSTGVPFAISALNQKPKNFVNLNTHSVSSIKPYTFSTLQSTRAYEEFLKQSTPKSVTTISDEQLSTLQNYWNNLNNAKSITHQSTFRPSDVSIKPHFEKLYTPTIQQSTQSPLQSFKSYSSTPQSFITGTTKSPRNRKPIPKPSPEMNDYYYDDDEDEHYNYEPVVKPKYMPSTEVKPQRPPMAQNYKEYEDIYEDSDEHSSNIKQAEVVSNRPIKYISHIAESVPKNQNDVPAVTKAPFKETNKNLLSKGEPGYEGIDYNNLIKRPNVSNYEINHLFTNNKETYTRKPIYNENSLYITKPSKYLNQTTLRPYTVRHRLAKPAMGVGKESKIKESKQNRGRARHPNIVAQMLSTPRDNYNQETRYTKAQHDGKSNSLEPTESVSPSSFAPSPRPKMLYNGSQNYSPDQFDPFYAIYDEDGELYKDTDYVQQYNTASLRPAVQQTYRGTPPPSRRPVETYTPRPVLADDYDDALIQGQINNQNQYQSPIRHSTRSEGNDLGYEHNPSSVRTTVYEATTLSTTPSTTSTSTTTTTTTQRSTTALFTEAMTQSRFTSRLSADENLGSSPSLKSFNDSTTIPSTLSPIINFSSRAKPFQKTDNSHRLVDISQTTERLPTRRLPDSMTSNSSILEKKLEIPKKGNKNTLPPMTTGFSIRRNFNNTKNPYTLTVITRPQNSDETSQKVIAYENKIYRNNEAKRFNYDTNKENINYKEPIKTKVVKDRLNNEITSRKPLRGSNKALYNTDFNESIKLKTKHDRLRSRIRTTAVPEISKYYLKNIVKRPVNISSTEGIINDVIENVANLNHHINKSNMLDVTPTASTLNINIGDQATNNKNTEVVQEIPQEELVSSYHDSDNLRNPYVDDSIFDYTTSSTSTTMYTTTEKQHNHKNNNNEQYSLREPSYYSYIVDDEIIPERTTEVFNGKVGNVIKAFFNNFVSNPRNVEDIYVTTPKAISTTPETVVKIGYRKKFSNYVDVKPIRTNIKYLQIITEPSESRSPSFDPSTFKESTPNTNKGLLLGVVPTASYDITTPLVDIISETTLKIPESSADSKFLEDNDNVYDSKFKNILTSTTPIEKSRKYQNIISQPINENDYLNIPNTDYIPELTESTKPTVMNEEEILTTPDTEQHQAIPVIADVASTTSTTKSTTTVNIEPKVTTKSLSFPTRASRVNPAIKLAAANLGSGRRSYQSSTNCSSDNSLQANPKCNEIKYQRPSSTRGRGSAHYSTSSGSEAPQQPQQTNRGTPPTRSRPTLKPSTAIVSETKFVDIYAHPPRRPAPVYPQPTPDKTAAKCRKDVCLLPDCFCGGKDIPGDLPVETVPQIVLLTFDDSVNDLNKVLYSDLFEKGRVNPNGCPITATFYVSHEWTDYSQVQNLYAAGHEMASHTISHSFGEQFSQKKWNREVGGQREILAAYGGVKLEDVRGMRAPFLSVGGNKMFKMLYDSNFTYDSSLPVYENRPPSWPYTFDYKLFHDCMIPPCPTKSYPGVWEVPMVMWQDLNGGRCSMGDACANPPESEGVYKMLLKNFDRHYTTNRAPFGLFYHAAWFTQPHHKEGFIMFLDYINKMKDVWIVTNWQALQWVRDPTPISRLNNFQPFQCNYQDRPKKCNNPKVCNLWHKSGVRYMRTCQPCPEIYPWTGKTGIKSSRIDNDIED